MINKNSLLCIEGRNDLYPAKKTDLITILNNYLFKEYFYSNTFYT